MRKFVKILLFPIILIARLWWIIIVLFGVVIFYAFGDEHGQDDIEKVLKNEIKKLFKL